ncbi:MAG: hypothetical protein AAFQ52_09015 [Chloroflexota bacterium]
MVYSTSVDIQMTGLEILETDALDAGGFEIVNDEALFISIETVERHDKSDVGD